MPVDAAGPYAVVVISGSTWSWKMRSWASGAAQAAQFCEDNFGLEIGLLLSAVPIGLGEIPSDFHDASFPAESGVRGVRTAGSANPLGVAFVA